MSGARWAACQRRASTIRLGFAQHVNVAVEDQLGLGCGDRQLGAPDLAPTGPRVRLAGGLWHTATGMRTHLVSTQTRALLRAVAGNIWLAETGGIISRHNGSHADFPQSAAHAATVTRYVLNTLGSLSPRIKRVYLYEWNARSKQDGWDTALISYTGAPREGYVVLAQTLLSWGIRPNCSISRVPPTCTGLGGGGRPTSGATGATGATSGGASG